MKYAAKIVENEVVQVVVGDAEWAAANLGGFWVGSDTKVGVGWLWNGETLTAPPPPELPELPDGWVDA